MSILSRSYELSMKKKTSNIKDDAKEIPYHNDHLFFNILCFIEPEINDLRSALYPREKV